jgi:ribosomal protein S18 acetylase RimI-like enzyme
VSLPKVPPVEFEMRPIDRDRDRDHVIAYARDVFTISFGSIAKFVEEFGPDASGLLPWIADRQAVHPSNAALALFDGAPAGMVVIGSWVEDAAVGYVYHYYLEPHLRGRGLAARLDEYAASVLTLQGHRTARLSVARSNHRALGFYRKQGWTEAGPRPGQAGIIYMQKMLPESG